MEKIKNYKDSQYYSSAQQRLREVVWLGNTFGSCQVKSETRGQRENRKRGRPLQIGRWQFYNNKQQNLYTGLVLGGHKMSRSPHRPTRILRVYIEVLIGFNPIFSSGGVNHSLLSQVFILETESHCRNSGQNVYS